MKKHLSKGYLALAGAASAVGSFLVGMSAHAQAYTPVPDTALVTAATNAGQDQIATIKNFVLNYWPYALAIVAVGIVYTLVIKITRKAAK